MKRSGSISNVEAAVGYAADSRGRGVAYSRVRVPGGEHLLRVPFRLRNGFDERETSYAALTAVAQALRRRGVRRAKFRVDDLTLVRDIASHGDVPSQVVLPYVRLRCALNQLESYDVCASPDEDLAARAKAEVALAA